MDPFSGPLERSRYDPLERSSDLLDLLRDCCNGSTSDAILQSSNVLPMLWPMLESSLGERLRGATLSSTMMGHGAFKLDDLNSSLESKSSSSLSSSVSLGGVSTDTVAELLIVGTLDRSLSRTSSSFSSSITIAGMVTERFVSSIDL